MLEPWRRPAVAMRVSFGRGRDPFEESVHTSPGPKIGDKLRGLRSLSPTNAPQAVHSKLLNFDFRAGFLELLLDFGRFGLVHADLDVLRSAVDEDPSRP